MQAVHKKLLFFLIFEISAYGGQALHRHNAMPKSYKTAQVPQGIKHGLTPAEYQQIVDDIATHKTIFALSDGWLYHRYEKKELYKIRLYDYLNQQNQYRHIDTFQLMQLLMGEKAIDKRMIYENNKDRAFLCGICPSCLVEKTVAFGLWVFKC